MRKRGREMEDHQVGLLNGWMKRLGRSDDVG